MEDIIVPVQTKTTESNNSHEISELNTTDKLVFSDSEDNDEPSNQIVCKSKKHKKIIDSDCESDSDYTKSDEIVPNVDVLIEDNEKMNMDNLEIVTNPKENGIKTNIVQNNTLIDSDSDLEIESLKVTKVVDSFSNDIEKIISEAMNISTNNDEQNHTTNVNKAKSNLIDSDSDSESDHQFNNRKKINKMQFTDDSTDKDSNDEENAKSVTKPRNKKKIKKKMNQKLDSENESDSDDEVNSRKQVNNAFF